MIEVNGRTVDWEEGMTVEELLEKMNYTFPKIIVRVNGSVVEKKLWPKYLVPDQSSVQAHHLIAGG
jgi:sulfur carrier protein